MCLESSLMKAWQNRLISLSLFPLGSKSHPPLPPPMFTVGSVHVSPPTPGAYSQKMDSRTSSQGICEDLLETQKLEDGKVDGRVKSEATRVRANGRDELHSISS